VIAGAVRIDEREPTRPELWRIDARDSGANDSRLRELARTLSDRLRRPYVSRTYAFPWAYVAVHDGPVGVDLERIAPCSSAFASLICAPGEGTDPRIVADPDTHLTNLWSSKEALAKALGDALDYEPARLASPLYWPSGRSGRWMADPITDLAGYCGWICWTARLTRPRRAWTAVAVGG